ncbi:hypothetical protein ACC723_38360, partial [Rhizobium ruizarguesonis]
PLQNLGRLFFANLEAVDTPDDYTAIFLFSNPTPFQLIRNALPVVTSVVAKHIFYGTYIARLVFGELERTGADQRVVGRVGGDIG